MKKIACSAALLFAIGIPLAPGKANAGFVSASGEFNFSWLLPHEESCRTGKPQGSYSSRNGSRGIVYPADCESPLRGGDAAKYNFVDSDGTNSCSGGNDYVLQLQSLGCPNSLYTMESNCCYTRTYLRISRQ